MPQQLLGLWDAWTAWESLLPLQVSRALGAKVPSSKGGLSPDSCPRPFPFLALQTAEKGRRTARGETQKARKGHKDAERPWRMEPGRGRPLFRPHVTDHTDKMKLRFLCWDVGISV